MRVACGEHNERVITADESVGAVLEFAGRIPFRLDVSGLLELERTFARDGIVHSTAKEEERLCRLERLANRCDLLLPPREEDLECSGDFVKLVEVRLDDRAGHASENARGIESEQLK